MAAKTAQTAARSVRLQNLIGGTDCLTAADGSGIWADRVEGRGGDRAFTVHAKNARGERYGGFAAKCYHSPDGWAFGTVAPEFAALWGQWFAPAPCARAAKSAAVKAVRAELARIADHQRRQDAHFRARFEARGFTD